MLVVRDLPASPYPVSSGSRPVLTGVAARIAGCDASTVRRAAAKGELPAYRLGPRGAWRIAPEALREWARTAQPERIS